MEYKYFVSYFDTTNSGFGFGRCEVTLEEKIECIDDIEHIEEGLVKGDKEITKATIINYQLLEEIKKEVE